MAIQAGLMADAYGMLPTEVLDQSPSDFYLNAAIRSATVEYKQEQRKDRQNAQTEAGVATPEQKDELVQANEDRAERRENLDGQVGLADQLDGYDPDADPVAGPPTDGSDGGPD